MNRVVITGQGSINALGLTASATRAALREGRPGIAALDIPDVERLTIRIGAQVTGYKPEAHFSRQEISLFDRFAQFAQIAAHEAVRQSGLEFSESLGNQTGVILGSAGGGLLTQEDNYRAVFQAGKNRVHPFVVPRLMQNAATSQLSMQFGLKGPCYSVSTACASSNHAMGQAFHQIRSGACPVMLTGGSEAMLSFGGLKAWEGLRVMSPDACRPFSHGRNGLVMGEGAAVFVFEALEHARARGADILAEVAGFAMNSDAGDIVAPSREGAARAISAALKDAALNPADIGYVNAHGTGTTLNDKTESAALNDVFGERAGGVSVSSSKSMHGHLIGATGAVELLAVILALQDGVIAPTISYLGPDPDCPIDVVANAAREVPVNAAISSAFAFGGLNAVLVLKRF